MFVLTRGGEGSPCAWLDSAPFVRERPQGSGPIEGVGPLG